VADDSAYMLVLLVLMRKKYGSCISCHGISMTETAIAVPFANMG